MKKKLIILSGFVLSLSPVVALAAVIDNDCASTTKDVETLFDFLCRIGQLLNFAVPILIALAVLLFVIGVVFYVVGSDEAAKKKGRDRMIYGIIGLAVILALWGLVFILIDTFGISENADTQINLPTVGL